jgi:hypothetical protein
MSEASRRKLSKKVGHFCWICRGLLAKRRPAMTAGHSAFESGRKSTAFNCLNLCGREWSSVAMSLELHREFVLKERLSAD